MHQSYLDFSPFASPQAFFAQFECAPLSSIIWRGVRWSGPDDAHVMNYVDVANSAFLEAGATSVAYRRKGVATALIRETERVARTKGCRQIGLSVGSTDNPEEKRLYEHLGYVDWGRGEFLISWEYIDTHGNQGTESEVVTYLHKRL